MKLSIYSYRRADSVQPDTIVAKDNDPDRPLHIIEVRSQVTDDNGGRLIELFGRPTADREGRRRRLTYDDTDEVMVLPDSVLARHLWAMVIEATEGALPEKAPMPGPLADQPQEHRAVAAHDGGEALGVRHHGIVWVMVLAPDEPPQADAAPEPDDQGA